MENPEFLREKYSLHSTPEADSAARRTEARTGGRVGERPRERIQNYLDRFTEIVEREEPEKRERGIEALKRVLHDKFVIKPEEVPERYFANQRRLAREQGHGDVDIPPEMREQLAEAVVADQESSLDAWVDYLASAEGLKLPESIGGDLDLRGLASAEGLQLPERVGGDLDLNSLASAEGLELPERIGGGLYLDSLASAEGLELPERIGGDLNLNGLASAEREKLRKRHPQLRII